MRIDSVRSLNVFLFFKLPSAFWCGVRAYEFTPKNCDITVRYRWINQNPFRSMYFAVQAMAAELATGALVMYHLQKSNHSLSMLVTENTAQYFKKATGLIHFTCHEGDCIEAIIKEAITTKNGQTLWLTAVGKNEQGIIVSEMKFCWSIKIKTT